MPAALPAFNGGSVGGKEISVISIYVYLLTERLINRTNKLHPLFAMRFVLPRRTV